MSDLKYRHNVMNISSIETVANVKADAQTIQEMCILLEDWESLKILMQFLKK